MGSMTENIADKAINDTRIVKQFTNPVKEPIDSDINLFDLLDNRAKRDPEGAMIEYKGDDGTWHPYSAQVFRDMVIDLAKGLIGLGVNKGDSVAIVSHTRWEWTALDMAIMSIGALTVPVYETNSASQVSWIFNDSKVTLAIAEDDGQRDKIESVRSEVPTLRNVFVIEAGGLNAIKTYGESVTDAEFWEYKEASHGDDRATIVYTSGSTGTPKGVELTHRNFAFLVLSALQYMPRAGAWPNRRLLLFLPLSHVFARFMEFFSFGGTISLAPELQYEDDGQGLRDLRSHAAARRAACVREGLQRRLPARRHRIRWQDVHARRRKRARMVQGRAEGRTAADCRTYRPRLL